MQLKVKIYSCYELTYTKIYKDILKFLYADKNYIDNAKLEIVDLSEGGKNNIQSQRSKESYATRTISIYEDDTLKHIVGISNTNYDYDKKKEFEEGKSIKEKNTFGIHNYHANTYIKQGIPSIFNYYFENKDKSVDLSFYLLDVEETYPHNLFNILSYRELETIGFKILNINKIKFDEYNKCCKSVIDIDKMQFANFEKYLRDIAYISKKNQGNIPSFVEYMEYVDNSSGDEEKYITEGYTYTFKSLSAQGYDSLLRCWCLKVLADKENKYIRFRLGKQYFAYDEDEKKIADKLTGPILKTFEYANINIDIVEDDTFLIERKIADETYVRYREKGELRNQTLFRNNLRKTGIPVECACCGQDNTSIIDAAHIYEVNKVKTEGTQEFNKFIKENNLENLIDNNSKYKNEIFFKKYSIVNAGENGIWLCKNHHGLFDNNYYCFDCETGKIVLHFKNEDDKEKFLKTIKSNCTLNNSIMTKARKIFFKKRNEYI